MYLGAVVVTAAVIAPILFWTAQSLAIHPTFSFLRQFDFEVFFHRALLVTAALFLWPLLRNLPVRTWQDLGLTRNPHRGRHLLFGIGAALIPMILCAVLLVGYNVYSLRATFPLRPLALTIAAAAVVPVIEETFFRGLVLGILLRTGRITIAMLITSGLFSIVHFLKAPEGTSAEVTWGSGFRSIGHAFAHFSEPALVLAGFTTLLLIGWVLADSRVRTASLWLSIGLHAGWITGNGVFNRIARREMILLPWIGRNLLIGIIPLVVICCSWIAVRVWLAREHRT